MSGSEYQDLVLAHYGKSDVQKEIARYSQSRWVAVHCDFVNPQGYPVLLRYRRGTRNLKVPLTITKPEEVPHVLKQFEHLKPRTFYASISVYKELSRPEHVKDLKNIMLCAPTWDIDNDPEKWKATIEAAKEITRFLREEGVSKSVFLKWSGKGAHVHVHQKAFSPHVVRRIGPLNAAYSIVEYTNRTLKARFAAVATKYNAPELSIENEIDIQRVFSCPLSLHRSLSRVVVCFPPESINEFVPEWTRVKAYRHWDGWDQFEEGEADRLAEKAYRRVGAYSVKTEPKPKLKPSLKSTPMENSITKWLKDD